MQYTPNFFTYSYLKFEMINKQQTKLNLIEIKPHVCMKVESKNTYK